MKNVILRNGIEIPQIGLGTWQINDRELLKRIISKAYEVGYRLIDTAAAYSNEIAIAKAIADSGIPREKFILSDKVWNTSRGYNEVQNACKKSLKKLRTDYFDLYLIHWPASTQLYKNWAKINAETWSGMEKLYKDGYVRSIGVCNFKKHHLKKLEETADIMPFINQIELHPGMRQNDIASYCNQKRIQIEASSPLGNGQVLQNETLKSIAYNKKKSTAQIALRWEIQKDFIVIPKTSKLERLSNNLNVFDFELNIDEMKIIDNITYCGGLGIDPDEVTEFG